uniref:Serpentine receptor class gamma n=1 Tax=Panagrellus redivivus TaxID=6233 RepID=A0A7E4VRP4_PANRE
MNSHIVTQLDSPMGAANPNWWFITASFFVGQAVQLIFIIFLTVELVFKRKTKLKQAYYRILYITYILDTLDNIAWFYDEMVEYKVGDVGVAIAQVIIWYYIYSIGTHKKMRIKKTTPSVFFLLRKA